MGETLGNFPVKCLLALLEGTKMHLEDTKMNSKREACVADFLGGMVWLKRGTGGRRWEGDSLCACEGEGDLMEV